MAEAEQEAQQQQQQEEAAPEAEAPARTRPVVTAAERLRAQLAEPRGTVQGPPRSVPARHRRPGADWQGDLAASMARCFRRSTLKHMALQAGAVRVRRDAIDVLRCLVAAVVREACRSASWLACHGRRRTILPQDVAYAGHLSFNRELYSAGPRPKRTHHDRLTRPKKTKSGAAPAGVPKAKHVYQLGANKVARKQARPKKKTKATPSVDDVSPTQPEQAVDEAA